jgi:hypothetical protein
MPSSDNLTPSESAILVVLLSEGRDISNKELQERFGTTLTGKSREKLNTLGYVESWKIGQAYSHRLGEVGWARCKEPLNFEKVRPLALGAALTSLLAAVHRDLERTQRSLAMVFAPEDSPVVHPQDTSVAPADLGDRIRVAYKELAREPGGWVSLADLRDQLGSVAKEEVDAALRELEQEPDIDIVPQANEKALSERNRRAAVTIGLQPKHFIAIGV